MAQIEGAFTDLNGTVIAAVDPVHDALRVVQRPLDHMFPTTGQVLGHYKWTVAPTAAAWSANARLATLRFTSTNGSSCVITRVSAVVAVATAVTAQRIDPLLMTKLRAFTAADSSNTNTFAVTGDNAKVRTQRMGTGQAVLYGASAAAGMSGGTAIVDSGNYGMLALPGLAGLGTAVGGDLYNMAMPSHPIVLDNQEGIAVSWGVTAVATGTVQPYIQVEWAEVPSFGTF